MGLGFWIDLKLSGKLNWGINYHHTKNQVDQTTLNLSYFLYGVSAPLPDEWLSRKTDHLKNGFGLLDQPETFWEA